MCMCVCLCKCFSFPSVWECVLWCMSENCLFFLGICGQKNLHANAQASPRSSFYVCVCVRVFCVCVSVFLHVSVCVCVCVHACMCDGELSVAMCETEWAASVWSGLTVGLGHFLLPFKVSWSKPNKMLAGGTTLKLIWVFNAKQQSLWDAKVSMCYIHILLPILINRKSHMTPFELLSLPDWESHLSNDSPLTWMCRSLIGTQNWHQANLDI